MEFEKVIKTRTAVRKFKTDKLTKEQIDKILYAGLLAPTAKNNQPQRIYVVTKDEDLAKLDQASPCRYNAPAVLIVCSNKNEAFSLNNHSTYEIDASIVATHMMLEATNLGIGSIWVDMFDRDKIKELFNIEEEPVCLMPIGYKQDDYIESINHNNRKPLEEIAKYL